MLNVSIRTVLCLSSFLFLLSQCKYKANTLNHDKITLSFTVNEQGDIIEADIRDRVLELGKYLNESGDKMVMYVYTEETGSEENNKTLANTLSVAVK